MPSSSPQQTRTALAIITGPPASGKSQLLLQQVEQAIKRGEVLAEQSWLVLPTRQLIEQRKTSCENKGIRWVTPLSLALNLLRSAPTVWPHLTQWLATQPNLPGSKLHWPLWGPRLLSLSLAEAWVSQLPQVKALQPALGTSAVKHLARWGWASASPEALTHWEQSPLLPDSLDLKAFQQAFTQQLLGQGWLPKPWVLRLAPVLLDKLDPPTLATQIRWLGVDEADSYADDEQPFLKALVCKLDTVTLAYSPGWLLKADTATQWLAQPAEQLSRPMSYQVQQASLHRPIATVATLQQRLAQVLNDLSQPQVIPLTETPADNQSLPWQATCWKTESEEQQGVFQQLQTYLRENPTASVTLCLPEVTTQQQWQRAWLGLQGALPTPFFTALGACFTVLRWWNQSPPSVLETPKPLTPEALPALSNGQQARRALNQLARLGKAPHYKNQADKPVLNEALEKLTPQESRWLNWLSEQQVSLQAKPNAEALSWSVYHALQGSSHQSSGQEVAQWLRLEQQLSELSEAPPASLEEALSGWLQRLEALKQQLVSLDELELEQTETSQHVTFTNLKQLPQNTPAPDWLILAGLHQPPATKLANALDAWQQGETLEAQPAEEAKARLHYAKWLLHAKERVWLSRAEQTAEALEKAAITLLPHSFWGTWSDLATPFKPAISEGKAKVLVDSQPQASPASWVTPDCSWRGAPESSTKEAYLQLSPSAVGTYMKCPRWYHYQSELKLEQPEQPLAENAAMPGQLLHQIWAVFNSGATPENHTPERLITLGERLLAVESHRLEPLPEGWLPDELNRYLWSLTALARDDKHKRLLQGLVAWCERFPFYFERPIERVEAETDLATTTLPGFPEWLSWRKMRPDAVVYRADGSVELIDYKHYGSSRFDAKFDTETKKLNSVYTSPVEALELEPETLPSHREIFPADKLGYRSIQLPVYAMALREQLKAQGLSPESLSTAALAIVRPEEGKATPHWLPLDIEPLQQADNPLAQWVTQYVLTPIQEKATRDPAPDRAVCGYCPYAPICDAAETDSPAYKV